MSKETPGKWTVQRMRPQPNPFFVFREICVDDANSHYEHMRDENGAIAGFETEADALEAITKAEAA